MGGVNRPEAQVSEVTPIFPQLLGKLGSVGGRSLKAGDRKKTKTKPQNWDSRDRSWTPEVELGTEGTATKTCIEVEGQ